MGIGHATAVMLRKRNARAAAVGTVPWTEATPGGLDEAEYGAGSA